MLKIGEFSKLSHLTVKTLRFYEKEGLLVPAYVDKWNGYRYYETSQLESAAKIKAYRQLDLSIDEIKAILNGADEKSIFAEKAKALYALKEDIDVRLTIINHILEDEDMKYQVTVKEIPASIVYYSEVRLPKYSDMMHVIPEIGAECKKINPNLQCVEPSYSFCEYLDEEHKDADIMIRYNEAVVNFGVESENIKFREIPKTKVLSIFHKGAYEQIGEAYAFIMKYAEDNGYKVAGLSRECYIDGIWNKESVDEWLTEIQLPIK
jgi:DNA-binding transcriptional MerR regulator